MRYSNHFKEFVEAGVRDNYHIGTGNPNAHILYIGKESAIAEGNIEGKNWYDNNAASWIEHIQSNTSECLSYAVDEHHVFRKNKSWGKNTWSKYQRLTDLIYNNEHIPFHINFLEKVFTTEINDAPSKNSSTANKTTLNQRKLLFKESEFIQSFPVVVLACSNYIKNNKDLREIDEIFGVQYHKSFPCKQYNKTNWFYSHYNQANSKLVIHTRQLSADVKSELLDNMGALIQKHLQEIGQL